MDFLVIDCVAYPIFDPYALLLDGMLIQAISEVQLHDLVEKDPHWAGHTSHL